MSKMAAWCLGGPLTVTSGLEICFFFPTIGLPHKRNGTREPSQLCFLDGYYFTVTF